MRTPIDARRRRRLAGAFPFGDSEGRVYGSPRVQKAVPVGSRDDLSDADNATAQLQWRMLETNHRAVVIDLLGPNREREAEVPRFKQAA